MPSPRPPCLHAVSRGWALWRGVWWRDRRRPNQLLHHTLRPAGASEAVATQPLGHQGRCDVHRLHWLIRLLPPSSSIILHHAHRHPSSSSILQHPPSLSSSSIILHYPPSSSIIINRPPSSSIVLYHHPPPSIIHHTASFSIHLMTPRHGGQQQAHAILDSVVPRPASEGGGCVPSLGIIACR